ncbi:hypothetical protein AX769_21670 (plasmid) [Frondihabitans sp. PAMC 28766]|uniref:substrate-binding domain-containing protein n=1 Tax=Frondihabitans sp. PAMC 28766 TaxID=1795630 RepID=UPI00078C05BA|nr:LacI family DNA-binding transcriptional regulator [Frondihabitans sp. PAMC 28766]AMM22731.1 hypothetical protein AX769_21670 [Frondihabitans sp. PAMC 28766]
MSTMAEVAARAGVSKKTVSAVVNEVGQVRAETRDRVRTAIAELKYSPNPIARRLTAGRTGSITLALPHLGSSDLAALAAAVIAEGERLGLGVLCEPTGGSGSGDGFLRAMGGVTDGVLLVPDRAMHELPRDVPVVVLGNRSLDAVVDQVISPTGAAIEQLLVEVDAADDVVVIAERSDADLVPGRLRLVLVTVVDGSAGAGAAAMTGALATGRPIRGVVTLGTGLGIGAVHALRSAGVRIPEDVRVASIGAGAEPGYTSPGITTAAPPFAELVGSAVSALRARIAGSTASAEVTEVPVVVVRRRSTAR